MRAWLRCVAMVAIVAIVASVSAACAPTVDGPVERQRVMDRADAERLTAQLAALPGVVRAEVVLRRAASDPLTVAPPSVPATSVVVIVDDRADRAAIARTTGQLARAIAPEREPTIVVEVGAARPALAKVGPFTVEESSRAALRAVLAAAFVVIIALAGWIAWRERQRRGSSAQ